MLVAVRQDPKFAALPKNVAEENLQARIRGTILMTESNKFPGAIVLSTGNKSETAVGYATLYGDMNGGLAVISDVPKTLVFELARFVNRIKKREAIPDSIITRPPSAELKDDQKDTDSLPPYDVLDPILKDHIEDNLSAEQIANRRGFDLATIRRVIDMVKRNEYKRRQAPPGIVVTPKAFTGQDRRMPITDKYKEGGSGARLSKGHSLVVGKFAPFHNGHEMLIREALNQSEMVTVLAYDHPELTDIPASEMAQLILNIFDDRRLDVRVVYNAPPRGDTAEIREAHINFIKSQFPPDTIISKVFNNEWYGKDIAEGLGSQLVQVDPQKALNPISATQIRENPTAYFDQMHPTVAQRVRSATMVARSPEESRFKELLDASFVDRDMPEEEKEEVRKETLRLNPTQDRSKLIGMRKWDISEFDNPNLPAVIGSLENRVAFSVQKGWRILDMAIRMPGQGWAIPKELEPYKEAIQKAVEHERTVNPDFNEYYVYITVDQKKIEPEKSQRKGGYHSDAYVTQETKVIEGDVVVDHTYLISDSKELPTLFQPGPFSLKGIDPEDCAKVLQTFDTVSEGKEPVTYPPYTVVKLTPFDIHSAKVNKTGMALERTFIKISFSREKYNLVGNQINPNFDYGDWVWMLRDPKIRNHRNKIADWDREDKERFRLVNPAEINFSEQAANVPWAKPHFIWAKKTESVRAERAVPGEMIETRVNGFVLTVNIAQEGNWKITTSQGDQYFLSGQKFKERYQPTPNSEGFYSPIPRLTKMLLIKEPIRLRAPWGAMQYVPAGSVLVYLGPGDVYAIHRDNFNASYVRTDAQGNVLPFASVMNDAFIVDSPSSTAVEELKSQMSDLNPSQERSRLFEVQAWDIREFDKPHLPVLIGELEDKDSFSRYDEQNRIRVLDIAIHIPGQGWAIPRELAQFKEAIQRAVEAERLVNPDFENRFVHITVDQKIVDPDKPGRRLGLHADAGLTDDEGDQIDVTAQNRKYITKKTGRSDHAYIVHDTLPTEFYEGPFSLINSSSESTFEDMIRGQSPKTYANHTLLRLDAYDVHTAVLNKTGKPVQRTFFKIQFTEKLLDRPANTQNPNFDYDLAREVTVRSGAPLLATPLQGGEMRVKGQEGARLAFPGASSPDTAPPAPNTELQTPNPEGAQRPSGARLSISAEAQRDLKTAFKKMLSAREMKDQESLAREILSWRKNNLPEVADVKISVAYTDGSQKDFPVYYLDFSNFGLTLPGPFRSKENFIPSSKRVQDENQLLNEYDSDLRSLKSQNPVISQYVDQIPERVQAKLKALLNSNFGSVIESLDITSAQQRALILINDFFGDLGYMLAPTRYGLEFFWHKDGDLSTLFTGSESKSDPENRHAMTLYVDGEEALSVSSPKAGARLTTTQTSSQAAVNDSPITPTDAVTFVVRVHSATGNSGKLMLGYLLLDYKKNTNGTLTIQGLDENARTINPDDWKITTLEDSPTALEITFSMSDFKQILDKANQAVEEAPISEVLNDIKAVVVIDLAGLNPDIEGFDEETAPRLIEEVMLAHNRPWGRNAKFLLQGSEALRARLSPHVPLGQDFIVTSADALGPEYAKAERILVTSPARYQQDLKHFFIKARKAGDFINFRGALRGSISLARVGQLQATNPRFMEVRAFIGRLLGREISDIPQFIQVTENPGSLDESTRDGYAIPEIVTLPLNLIMQGARLARKWTQQAA